MHQHVCCLITVYLFYFHIFHGSTAESRDQCVFTDTCGAAVADYTQNARMYDATLIPTLQRFSVSLIPIMQRCSCRTSARISTCASVWNQVSVYFWQLCGPKCNRLCRNTFNFCRQNHTCHHSRTDVDRFVNRLFSTYLFGDDALAITFLQELLRDDGGPNRLFFTYLT